jgi:NitT/TauT family transport system substrate-binding protein
MLARGGDRYPVCLVNHLIGESNMFHRAAVLAISTTLLATAAPALAADNVKFVLDWFPAGYCGFVHVGVKRGFFAEENLNVTIDIGRGGADAVNRVASSTDDFGGAAFNSIFNAAANASVPVKAVLSVYSKAPDSIVYKEGSGIRTIKDLVGKSMATATFSSSNPVWPVVARANGVDPAKVNLVMVDDNALGPMLASGRVDALITWMMSVPLYAKLAQPAKLQMIPWSETGVTGYNWSLIASDKIIKERPEAVRHFVKAFLKTMQFFIDNPEQAGKDLHDVAPETVADVNIQEIKMMLPLVKNEISAKYGMGTLEPELLKQAWLWVAKSQNFPVNKIDPEKVVDRSFIPKL